VDIAGRFGWLLYGLRPRALLHHDSAIERFWRYLKAQACANRLFKSIAELLDSVDKVLTSQNDLVSS